MLSIINYPSTTVSWASICSALAVTIPATTGAGVLVFDAADVGEPNLGYIAENRALQSALLAAFAEAGGHIEPAPLSALAIGE